MIDWLNDNTGAVQAFLVFGLVVITAIYVHFTRRLADESQKTREGADRPQVLIDIPSTDDLEWIEVEDKVRGAAWSPTDPTTWPDPFLAYPKTITCRIVNVGRGAAKEVSVTAAHHSMSYDAETKDFLAPGDEWHVTLKAFPLAHAMRQSRNESSGWAERLAAAVGTKQSRLPWRTRRPTFDPHGYNFGILASCRDIHGRIWITYLKFGLSTGSTVGATPPRRSLLKQELQIVESHWTPP